MAIAGPPPLPLAALIGAAILSFIPTMLILFEALALLILQPPYIGLGTGYGPYFFFPNSTETSFISPVALSFCLTTPTSAVWSQRVSYLRLSLTCSSTLCYIASLFIISRAACLNSPVAPSPYTSAKSSFVKVSSIGALVIGSISLLNVKTRLSN